MSHIKRLINRSLPVVLALSLLFTPLMTVSTAGQAVRSPSALLLDDNFNYGSTPGNLTTVSGGIWVAHSGAGSGPVQYITSGLSMPGYGSSGVGGAATISTAGSEDVNRSFANQTSGTVYFAALVNVSQAQTGDYFLHLKDATTGFRARVFVKNDGGILRFGLGTTGAATYSTADFAYNTTYLVVVKYEVTTGNTALYVLDVPTPTEPGTPLVYLAGSGTQAVQAIAIRQGSSGQRPAATIDGVRVGNTWEEAIGFTGYLAITKEVTPTSDVTYHGTVTYTVTLENSMAVSDTVLFTDTLPAEVDFGAWIEQPTGATVTNDEITWSGTLTASTVLTFSFTAVHVGDYGDVVTNTAIFSGTAQTGSASAVFTVEELTADVTFFYHDLEDVVHAGESVYLAGTFNGWTPALMNAAGNVYSLTVPGLTIGNAYNYKYIVHDTAAYQWDWLNTANRTITVTSGLDTVDDYRNVIVGWANLQWPYTLQADAGQATDPVYGRVYISNVTNPAGEGRSIRAQVGYGDSTDPATWSWFPMTYNTDNGNNDEFMGVMTPTVGGVYSYTTRFDGNWGAGNPNAGWTYGDITGVGPYPGGEFSLSDTGILTSTIYDIAVTKTALTSEAVVHDGESALVTYTIQIDNLSTITPTNAITIADVLPAGFVYVGDDSGQTPSGTGAPGDPLTWVFTSPLAAGESISFTLLLSATDAITQNGIYVNAVAITVDPPDALTANNSDDAAVTVYRVIPIGQARTLMGSTVTIEGVVTVEPGVFTYQGNPRYMYIQDASGGILVYYGGSGLNPLPRHHLARVTGQITEYRAETEIIPPNLSMVIDLGPDTPVTPLHVNTGEVGEDVEGQLIHIAGTIIAKPNAYTLVTDDGSGDVDVYRFYNLGQPSDPNYIDFTPFVVGDYISVTGVTRGYNYSGVIHREVLPRGPADIVELYPVTFVYHDLEDVVHTGEEVHLRGEFNGWGTSPITMAHDANYTVFTATVILENPDPYAYKYYVPAAGDPGGWDLLNTNNRSVTVTAPQRVDDYRNVVVGWAILQWPPSITINLGQSTGNIYGRLYISNVTNPAGEGRGIRAQVGYGNSTDPATWSWFPMTYNTDNGNNDEFMGVMTPTVGGIFSYTTRFDGNWGAGNPNAGWTYGDITGVGPYPGGDFSLSDTGVLTVTAPDLSIAKSIAPTSDVDLGDAVTCTITLSNNGDGEAVDVDLIDTLPAGVIFRGFVQQSGASYNAGVISWNGNLPAGAELTIVFTATVDMDTDLYGQTITNTAEFNSANDGAGDAQAAFTVIAAPELAIAKTVEPDADVEPGGVVTYTITLSHSGGAAYVITLTDTLPAGVTFGGFIQGSGASYDAGAITWNGDLPAETDLTIVFTATVDMDWDLHGQTITNTVAFSSLNGGAGSDQAAFTVRPLSYIYLPLVARKAP